MILHYTVTEEDYIQFNLFHQKNSKEGKRQLLLFRLLTPALILIFLLALVLLTKMELLFVMVFFVVFSIVFWFLAPRSHQKTVKKGVKRFLKEGKNKDLLGQKTFTLLDDKFCEERELAKEETSYQAIERIAQDGGRVYIYTGALQAYIIPFSAFRDETHKKEFLAAIKAKASHITLPQ